MDAVGCRTVISGLISTFVFDILRIPSGCIVSTCTPEATGLIWSQASQCDFCGRRNVTETGLLLQVCRFSCRYPYIKRPYSLFLSTVLLISEAAKT